MKAAYYNGKKNFKIDECREPAPDSGQVRVKVAFSGICGTDIHIYHGKMDARVKIPQVIGHEMSGTVESIGPDVKGFTEGDKVVVRPLIPCNECPACKSGFSHICHNLNFMGIDTSGSFQSLWTVPSYTLHRLGKDLSLKQAALIEPLAVACHDVRRGRVREGEKCVVIGGGPIGLLIALAAQSHGADVMVSEINDSRLEIAASLGLKTNNPDKTDLVQDVDGFTGLKGADAVFEVSASESGAQVMTELVSCRGRIVMVGIHPEKREVDLLRFFWREIEMIGARVYEKKDYEEAIFLVQSGELSLDPFISRCLPLDKIQDAFTELENNPSSMKIVLEC